MTTRNNDSRLISQALFALGHTMDCVASMRNCSRLTCTQHIYGRPTHIKEVKVKVRNIRDTYFNSERPLYQQYYKALNEHRDEEAEVLSAQLKASRKEMNNKVQAFLATTEQRRLGKPFHLLPIKEQIRGLILAGPLLERCHCGCPRNPRSSTKLLPMDISQAAQFYAKSSAGLEFEEYLHAMFGRKFTKLFK